MAGKMDYLKRHPTDGDDIPILNGVVNNSRYECFVVEIPAAAFITALHCRSRLSVGVEAHPHPLQEVCRTGMVVVSVGKNTGYDGTTLKTPEGEVGLHLRQ